MLEYLNLSLTVAGDVCDLALVIQLVGSYLLEFLAMFQSPR